MDPLLGALVWFGIDQTLAGAILFFAMFIALLLIFRMVLGESKGMGYLVPTFVSLGISFALGWLDVWIGIILVLGILVYFAFQTGSESK